MFHSRELLVFSKGNYMAYSMSLVVAHELGHAVVAAMLDNEYEPICIEMKPDDGLSLAYCNLHPLDVKKGNKSIHSASKLHHITDLGGIFGELLFGGEFEPWGSRSDVDNFLCVNSQSRGKLVEELFDWMWNDDDALSWWSVTREIKDRKKKYQATLDLYDVEHRLPHLWSIYKDFIGKIDRKEFKNVVDEIARSKVDYVGDKELNEYLDRIILECE